MTVLEFTLTRQQLEDKRAILATQGIALSGDKGDVSQKGVQLTFDYTEPKLVITIVDAGGYPTFMVKHKINAWFQE